MTPDASFHADIKVERMDTERCYSPTLDDDVLREAFDVALMVVRSDDIPEKSADWLFPELVCRTGSRSGFQMFCDDVDCTRFGLDYPGNRTSIWSNAPVQLGRRSSPLPLQSPAKTPRSTSYRGAVKQPLAATPQKSQSCKSSFGPPGRVRVKSKVETLPGNPDPPSGGAPCGTPQRAAAKKSSSIRRRSISAPDATPRGKSRSNPVGSATGAGLYGGSTPTRKAVRSVSDSRIGSTQPRLNRTHSKASANPRTGLGPPGRTPQRNLSITPRKCLTPREVENGASKLRSPYGAPQRLSMVGSPQIGSRTPSKRGSLSPAKHVFGGANRYK